jgi:transcriptional regulator with GAF, ATPase, and Fis domain
MVYPIVVPPLRERLEDVPRLVSHHLKAIATRSGLASLRLTPAALEKLLGYAWPGNVRELVNLLERAALLAQSSVIDVSHVHFTSTNDSSPTLPALVSYREAKAKFERDYFSQLMKVADGNVSLAAKLSDKTRKEVYDALTRCGLDTTGARLPGPAKRARSRTRGN